MGDSALCWWNETRLDFLIIEAEKVKLLVWKYYYLLQENKAKNGKYPPGLDLLKTDFPAVTLSDSERLKFLSTGMQFTLHTEDAKLKLAVSVDHDSKFAVKMLP